MIYPTPSHVALLNSESRAHTVGRLTLNAMTLDMYGSCPRLHSRLGDSAEPLLHEFVDQVVALQHPMDWTLHLELALFCRVDGPQLWEEACFAAVRRWVRTGPPGRAWIALRCAAVPYAVFIATRTSSLDSGPRLIKGRLGESAPMFPFMYQIGDGFFSSPAPAWTPYLSLITT